MFINELQAQLDELEPKRELIEAALPRELNPSDTLELIRENATRNNVRVDTTGIDDPVQNGNLKSTTINLREERMHVQQPGEPAGRSHGGARQGRGGTTHALHNTLASKVM